MTEQIKTHPEGVPPNQGDIFVFGSNLAGRHGAGAAKHAASTHGAKYGVGVGRTGSSYAIPTKGHSIEILPLSVIAIYVHEFVEYAKLNSEQSFFLTRVGCGLAGYTDSQIAPMFQGISRNVTIPAAWVSHIDMDATLKQQTKQPDD